MPLVHQLPELVIALRPAALCPPLRQRLRSAQCTGLAVEHFEIVFEIKDLLRPRITALVLRHPHTGLPELNHAGVDASLDHGAGLQRHRVEVRSRPRTSCLIDPREADFRQLEVFCSQWQQVFLLGEQQRADTLRAARDDTPLVVMQSASSFAFSSARSFATGTGTQWLRRK